MPTTLQRELPIGPVVTKAPTLPLADFARSLGESEAAVLECCEVARCLIGDRRIDWAWDLAAQGSGRRFVVIPTLYLVAEHRELELGLDEIAQVLFPTGRHQGLSPLARRESRHVSGVQFQYALGCSADHVATLISEGRLRLLRERTVTTGRNASPALTWESVRQFLAAQRL